MALGALPHPDRVPEQRLLSPEICRRGRGSCRTLSKKLPIVLGFSVGRLLIGERGVVRGGPGWPHNGWAQPGAGSRPPVVWAPSGSRLVLVLRPGKIGVSELVLSNSENISRVAFLKHKNSKKQGTRTVASC
jgi:hypothetical protein